jgi:anti-anti-sigma regulatory factor
MTSGRVEFEGLGAGALLVRVVGEHDLANADVLRDALRRPEGARLVVDLSETTFIDGTAVTTLLGADGPPPASLADVQAHLHRRDPELFVVAPEPSVARRVLDLVAADRVVRIFPDRESAVRSLGID